jgi:hypothetical protein
MQVTSQRFGAIFLKDIPVDTPPGAYTEVQRIKSKNLIAISVKTLALKSLLPATDLHHVGEA